MLGHFIKRLKEEIKTEVRLLHPVSLEQTMEIAVRVEDKMRVMGYKRNNLSSIRTGPYSMITKGPSTVSFYAFGPPTSPPVSRDWGARSPESQGSVQSPKRSGQIIPQMGEIRRLTEKELQEKRAKGLCYICDAKWAIGHRCRKKRTECHAN